MFGGLHLLRTSESFFLVRRFPNRGAAVSSLAMLGPILSVLLMGMIPVWSMQEPVSAIPPMQVSPPAAASGDNLQYLDQVLSASGAIIVDLQSGQTVYSHHAETSRPMASLTKLMTALIIVENHTMDEVVTVPADITNVIGTKAYLPPREQFTVGDVLSALLIDSANDAAVTLAEFHSGSVDAFVEDMNERALELGLKGTSYQNPTGLDAPVQRSTPQDLAWLAMYNMRYPAIAQRMATPYAEITSLNGKTLELYHTHQLLLVPEGGSTDGSKTEVVAGKTGTTDAAGECLLSIVEAGGRKYIAVLLHSQDRYVDMRQMLARLTP